MTDLRSRRLELGLTQEVVAQSAGMERSVYARLEAGQTRTTQDKAILIARTLDSTVEILFGASISPNNHDACPAES